MTLNPVCESVETSEGVPITVTGVAQCKIMRELDLLKTACEQFLGKSTSHIEQVVLQTLEGHLRSILGKQSFIQSTSHIEQVVLQTLEGHLRSILGKQN